MPVVSDTIPEPLKPSVDAAVAWFNTTDEAAGDAFKATGILDPDEALADPNTLRLILCGGDRCEQHSFRITPADNNWQIDFAHSAEAEAQAKPQAELDPPPGPRLAWLDKVLGQHDFVLLLFYRGFW